jgi:small subunit ribosomal protein S9
VAGLVQHLGTGRRKTAVARIFLRSGKGQITVNGRSFESYFVNEAARALVRQPLLAAELADKFDILILADGGGPNGQAGAARLGIARALLEFNSELRPKLKQLGLLSRDPRSRERKKYGQKGARKRFQFSKRLVWRSHECERGTQECVRHVRFRQGTQIPLWAVCAGMIGRNR